MAPADSHGGGGDGEARRAARSRPESLPAAAAEEAKAAIRSSEWGDGRGQRGHRWRVAWGEREWIGTGREREDPHS